MLTSCEFLLSAVFRIVQISLLSLVTYGCMGEPRGLTTLYCGLWTLTPEANQGPHVIYRTNSHCFDTIVRAIMPTFAQTIDQQVTAALQRQMPDKDVQGTIL